VYRVRGRAAKSNKGIHYIGKPSDFGAAFGRLNCTIRLRPARDRGSIIYFRGQQLSVLTAAILVRSDGGARAAQRGPPELFLCRMDAVAAVIRAVYFAEKDVV